MNNTPSHTESHSTFETSNRSNPAPTRHHYRRRDFVSPYFSENLAPNPKTLHRNSDLASQANPSSFERDREILDPKKQDDEILDPGRQRADREFPRKEDQQDINPNRQIPEEDNDLNDKDGAFIDEPTIDDDKFVPKKDTYYLTDEDGSIINKPARKNNLEEYKIASKVGQYYLTDEEGNIIKEPSRESEYSTVPGFARR